MACGVVVIRNLIWAKRRGNRLAVRNLLRDVKRPRSGLRKDQGLDDFDQGAREGRLHSYGSRGLKCWNTYRVADTVPGK